MSAKYKSPSFLLPNELNTSANTANDTGINSLYSMDFDSSSSGYIDTGTTLTGLGISTEFSVSFWFNSTDLVLWDTIINAPTPGNGHWSSGFGFSIVSSKLRFWINQWARMIGK